MQRYSILGLMTVIGLFATAPNGAAANEYKMVCKFGAKITTELYVFPEGNIAWSSAPDVVVTACRKEADKGKDVFTLPGFPGEYASADHIKRELDTLRQSLKSPAMTGVDFNSLPPALKFVKQLLINDVAAEAKKKSAGAQQK